jgi:hypothetical protein
MTPPPLPRDERTSEPGSSPPPIPPPVPSPPGPQPARDLSRKRSGMTWIRNILIAAVLLTLIVVAALAATCPDEARLRAALYGEIDPRYKGALEFAGRASKMLNGPCLVYHNHIIYSTLDFRQSDGSEVRMASGMAGRIQLTPQVKEIKDFILSIPGIQFILPRDKQ